MTPEDIKQIIVLLGRIEDAIHYLAVIVPVVIILFSGCKCKCDK